MSNVRRVASSSAWRRRLQQPIRQLTLGRSPHRTVNVANSASDAAHDNQPAGSQALPAIFVGPSRPNQSIKPTRLRHAAYFQR